MKHGRSAERWSRRRWLAAAGMLGLNALGARLLPAHVLAQSGPSCPFTVDAHCHVFSVLDLPIDGFILALGHGLGLPSQLNRLLGRATAEIHRGLVAIAEVRETKELDAAQVRAQIARLLDSAGLEVARLVGGDTAARIPAIIGALELSTRRPLRIAEALAAEYPSVGLLLPALVDYEYWTNRGRKGAPQPTRFGLRQQIDRHAAVFEHFNLRGAAGPAMHGYVPFNPLRLVHHEAGRDPVNPLHEIERAIGIDTDKPGLGYVGIKLYPPTGFVPLGNDRVGEFRGQALGRQLDSAMHALFRLCVEHDIPIISHASDGNGFGPDYGRRASPWGWWRVLEEYPELRLDLAHFGHDHGIGQDGVALEALAWSKFIAKRLMAKFPHVYADLGYSPVAGDRAYRDRYAAYLKDHLLQITTDSAQTPVIRDRLMYGSDWWMLHLEAHHASFLDCFRETIRLYSEDWPAAGLQERFFGRNALRFLGILDERDRLNGENATVRRLLRYYGDRSPGWLRGEPRSASCGERVAGQCVVR